MDKETGVMDIELWNYPAISYNLPQQRHRIRYHESLMTHAILITGCHVDETSKLPLRYPR
ncbi:CMF_collapsed_G0045270.mRNA.1.CDS.1 [Saccharomyces cerevisiae]|nr:CMF_collapsed_G0045270.mRNA.1.CDS.1 [Saccharomyces cerevisiae]